MQQGSMLEWSMSMLQANASMDKAIGIFGQACDKEVATMAAFKAMGMDPADAPRFGWGLSDRPRVIMSNISQSPTIQGAETPMNSGTKKSGMLPIILGFIAAGALGAAGVYAYNQPKNDMSAATIIQQQMADLKADIAKRSAPPVKPGMNPITQVQAEICEELETDPVFRGEIERDLAVVLQKIVDHRKKRLGQ